MVKTTKRLKQIRQQKRTIVLYYEGETELAYFKKLPIDRSRYSIKTIKLRGGISVTRAKAIALEIGKGKFYDFGVVMMDRDAHGSNQLLDFFAVLNK